MSRPRTVVAQSFRERDVPAWIEVCLASARAWTEAAGWTWRFEGDALLDRLPAWYRDKTRDRPMVAADLGRLLLARELLAEGWDRVVWLDADVLVFDPARLDLATDAPYAFGAETWVQRGDDGRLRAWSKVHNAVCVFARGNPLLDFYIHACERLVARYDGTPPPHLVGPRLLAVLHPLLDLPLLPQVGTFGPHVLRDVLRGGGPALDLHRARARGPVHAANLGASLVGVEHDGERIDDAEVLEACHRLLAPGGAARVNG